MKAVRYILWVLVAVSGFALGAFYIGQVENKDNLRIALTDDWSINIPLNWLGGNSDRTPGIGGPFTLVDYNGNSVDETVFQGKPSAVYFGFTFCPEVCPTTLLEMTAWAEKLGPDADKLNFVFVTVDPERDTPEAVKEYMSAFDPRFIGLTGTPEQVKGALKAYRVYARKVELDDGDYTMDHSAQVYLLDNQGDFFGTVAYGEQEETALQKLKRLLSKS